MLDFRLKGRGGKTSPPPSRGAAGGGCGWGGDRISTGLLFKFQVEVFQLLQVLVQLVVLAGERLDLVGECLVGRFEVPVLLPQFVGGVGNRVVGGFEIPVLAPEFLGRR